MHLGACLLLMKTGICIFESLRTSSNNYYFIGFCYHRCWTQFFHIFINMLQASLKEYMEKNFLKLTKYTESSGISELDICKAYSPWNLEEGPLQKPASSCLPIALDAFIFCIKQNKPMHAWKHLRTIRAQTNIRKQPTEKVGFCWLLLSGMPKILH